MYRDGYDVAQDYAEAVRWFRLAAAQRDAGARNNLGGMSYNGYGVAQDLAEAVRLYRLVAEHSDADGQHNLGVIYHNGEGVAQDYVQAHMWFDLATAQGNETAAESRNRVASLMTPAQIIEAQRLAWEWLEAHQPE